MESAQARAQDLRGRHHLGNSRYTKRGISRSTTREPTAKSKQDSKTRYRRQTAPSSEPTMGKRSQATERARGGELVPAPRPITERALKSHDLPEAHRERGRSAEESGWESRPTSHDAGGARGQSTSVASGPRGRAADVGGGDRPRQNRPGRGKRRRRARLGNRCRHPRHFGLGRDMLRRLRSLALGHCVFRRGSAGGPLSDPRAGRLDDALGGINAGTELQSENGGGRFGGVGRETACLAGVMITFRGRR